MNVEPRGYVRLRWKVGVGTYLECYEHRLVAGFPDADVHHENEQKGDNARENLTPLLPAEHARRHRAVDDALIALLYRTGMSTQRVAVVVNADAATVWRSLRRSGTPTRSRAEAARIAAR